MQATRQQGRVTERKGEEKNSTFRYYEIAFDFREDNHESNGEIPIALFSAWET